VNTVPKNEGFDNAVSEIIEPFFKRFNVNAILRRFYAVKQKGVAAYATFLFITGLVFTGKNLYGLLKTEPERIDFEKDVVYRFLGDSRIYWEQILSHIAYAAIAEIKKRETKGVVAANPIDDTTYYRDRSKKVELLSRCHDHTNGKYYKGFNLLCLGWTDGESFVPVKTQMVASGNNKNLLEGSHIKEDRRTLATRRRTNARKEKTKLTLQMLESIKGTPAQTKYALFDSWFESPLMLASIKNIGYDVVARAENNENYRYFYKGEMRSINSIYQINRKRRGKSRYLLSVDIEIRHKSFDEAVPAKLVYVRDRDNRKKWVAFICTDISLTEDQILDLYKLRWSIEPCFKVAKSFLHLESEFQGRSFDAITAHASIVMIRYIILAVRKRENDKPGTICDVFFSLCHTLDDLTFKSLFDEISVTIIQSVHDYLHIPDDMIDGFLTYFISKLPSNIKAKLDDASAWVEAI